MAGPVSDRLALSEATQSQSRADLSRLRGRRRRSSWSPRRISASPLIDTTTDDGIRHRIWAITDQDELAAIAADLLPRRATIADGHHRYANYLRYQEDRRAAGDGAGPWDFGLTLLVDTSVFGPQVHPIHRVIPLPAAGGRGSCRAASAFA